MKRSVTEADVTDDERVAESPPLAVIFAALADETRLQLIGLLAHKECCVCDLVDSLENPQPKISRHLAYLRRCGIVTTNRQGKWIRYALRQPLPDVLAALLPVLKKHAVPAAHTSPACCPEACVTEIETDPEKQASPLPAAARQPEK